LILVGVATRRVHLLGATTNPTAQWVVRQARNLMLELGERADRFRFLIRDRPAKYTGAFEAVSGAEDMEVLLIPPQAPRANAYAERWVRTLRRERLDRILIYNTRHPAGRPRRVPGALQRASPASGPRAMPTQPCDAPTTSY
jgi:putative transposase